MCVTGVKAVGEALQQLPKIQSVNMAGERVACVCGNACGESGL